MLYHAHQTNGAKACIINKVILEDDLSNLNRDEVNSPRPQCACYQSVFMLNLVCKD